MPQLLVLNAGSSSLKFRLFALDDLAEIAFGLIEKIEQPGSTFFARNLAKRSLSSKTYPESIADHQDALTKVLAFLNSYLPEIHYLGHRVVHGGEDFREPILVNEIILESLSKYNELAPLHNPPSLHCLAECLKKLPQAKNFAVFDTAFFKSLPPKAYLYPLPLEYYRQFKIRRYGFHGLSKISENGHC